MTVVHARLDSFGMVGCVATVLNTAHEYSQRSPTRSRILCGSCVQIRLSLCYGMQTSHSPHHQRDLATSSPNNQPPSIPSRYPFSTCHPPPLLAAI